jgi:hypothetical protein
MQINYRSLLGRSTDAGNLGRDFAMLSGIVLIALVIQLYFLRPKVNDFVDVQNEKKYKAIGEN